MSKFSLIVLYVEALLQSAILCNTLLTAVLQDDPCDDQNFAVLAFASWWQKRDCEFLRNDSAR